MHFSVFSTVLFIANLLCLPYACAFRDLPQEHHHMLSHHSFRVLSLGASCIDLIIPVSEEFLAQISGEKGGCEHIHIEELNRIKEIIEVEPKIVTGGSSANTIKALASLGEKCGFISHVGADPFGEHIIEYMKKNGVIGFFSKSNLPTTQVICFVTPDGQRTMRFFSGCTQEMTEEFLHPRYFENVELVHFSAYSLHKGNLVEEAMELAHKAGAKISLDLSSFEMIRMFRNKIEKLLLKYVDIVFANEDEIRELFGISPEEGCIKLQEICSIAVVLLGAKGCCVGHQGQILHSQAFPTKIVDTTGAGDFFASGFLYGYLRDFPLDICARMGNRMGSAIVEVQGAELSPEKWEEVRAFFREHELP